MLRGVPHCLAESVAEHSFWAAILSLEIASQAKNKGIRVDPLRAAAIALIHDMGESIIGDIAKVYGISIEEKRRAEMEAVKRLPVSGLIQELFEEFEKGSSLESKIARLSEMLATLLKALSYENKGYDVKDIRNNMLRGIRDLAEEIGITEIVREVSGLDDF
jgi:putative hydrolase of HD superfamily